MPCSARSLKGKTWWTPSNACAPATRAATAQFFINVKDNDFLDFTRESGSGWGYAVFGKVVEGQDIVDAIERVRTGRSGPYDDVPLEAVVIEKAVEAA